MKRDSRLSVALHVLLHMAERGDQPMTSEEMALCAGTNPVVIRRTFAGLRKAGIVTSTKGHHGGWRLGRGLADISLGQIQSALDEPVVAMPPAPESPGCLVERAVARQLDLAMLEARQVLTRRLATISLADLAADVGPMRHSAQGDQDHVA
jgi:Rrf2 family protein